MRVAFFENVGNNFFQIGRSLQERTDIDAHLFVDRSADQLTLPESDDPELANRRPSWIHHGAYITPSSLATPWRSSIVSVLREFDLVVTSGLGPLFAQFADRPYAFFVTGGDLTVRPFPIRFLRDYRGVRSRAAALLAGPWQRRGIRRADELWTPLFTPYARALDRLGVPRQRVTAALPVVIDTELFSPTAAARTAMGGEDARLGARHDFVVFHPSRLMIRDDARRRETGQWKQNDLFLRGFAAFVRTGAAERPMLVLIDRPTSPDMAVARRLIDELGIAENVHWLRPDHRDGFARHDLVALYGRADVVTDDFGIGWFGGVTLEALAMEKPVVQYIDDAVLGSVYPWHPIISASTVEQISAELERLCREPELRREVGRDGRRWVEEFHSHQAAAEYYSAALAALAARAPADQPDSR